MSHGGRTYFYNAKTGISQWDEPDDERREHVRVERPLTAPPPRRAHGDGPRNYRGAQRKIELARNGGVCALRGVFQGGRQLIAPPYNPWREKVPAKITAFDVEPKIAKGTIASETKRFGR